VAAAYSQAISSDGPNIKAVSRENPRHGFYRFLDTFSTIVHPIRQPEKGMMKRSKEPTIKTTSR
jgi:hypothetical protein